MTETTNTQNANSIIDPQLLALQKLLEKNPKALTGILNKAEEEDKPKMDLDRKNDGTIKNTINNIEEILQHDDSLKDKLGYNKSTQEYMVRDNIKLTAKGSTVTIDKGKLDDRAVKLLISYLSKNPNYKIETDSNHVMTAMEWIQQVQSYDPLKDYFNGLKWDGKERISHVLQDYLGAEDSEYNKFQIKLWLEGGVAKVYNKKQKFDFVLDLVGGQGAGKTTFLHNIAPLGMYIQGFPDFTSKDSLAMMKGSFIVNDDEMTATANSSFEEIKSFITAPDIQYRAPYGRLPLTYNKSFIIARTGNEVQHLSDPSGQRRFLCVQCGLHEHKVVYSDLKQDYIDQLWAEAKHYYEEAKKKGNLFSLTKQQEDMLNEHRQMFIKSNSVQDAVKELIKVELNNDNFISNNDMRLLAAHKLGKDKQGLSDRDKRSIRTQMAHSGWLSSAVKRDSETGLPTRGYKRIEKVKVNSMLFNVKDWISYEVEHAVVTSGRQMPANFKLLLEKKEEKEHEAQPLMKDNESYDKMPF